MRIGIIVPGGMHKEREIPALISLASRLSRKHQVFVLSLAQGQKETFFVDNAEVTVIPALAPFTQRGRLIQQLVMAGSIFARRNLDIIHGFWASHPGFIAGSLGRAFRIPIVVSIGGGELIWRSDIQYGGANSRRRRLVTRSALAMATRVTVGSRFAQAYVPGNSLVVPLGAEFPRERESPATPDGKFRILHVANIQPVKAPEVMLKVIDRVLSSREDAVFDWVGVDTMNGAISKQVKKFGNRVRLHGRLPHRCLRPMYASADAYVHTSHYESQCVALCEAASFGVPIVATSVGIAPELDGAIVHEPGDEQSIAESICTLMRDRKFASLRSTRVKRWAETYNAEWTADTFESIYSELKGI